jgi:hypothetical protein
LLHRTLIGVATAVVLGCIPVATNALAAAHQGGSARAAGGHATAGRVTAGRAAVAGPARSGRAGAGYAGGGRVVRYGGGYRNGPVYGGPIYDSCAGYGPGYGYNNGYGYGYNNGCVGNGVPLVGGVINGILGGYPY